jgi:hydrogenase maturation protein HypF
VLNPARIAFALLADAHESTDEADIPGIDADQKEFLRAMLDRGVNCPVTTSLGRVFDAAAAILGLVERVTYEGEGPIRLEGLGMSAFTPGNVEITEEKASKLLPFLPSPGDERLFLIDPRPLLAHLRSQLKSRSVAALSLIFHEAIGRASLQGARRLRQATGISRIALSGGVFQNLLLRELLVPLLIKAGFEVFLNVKVPPGDGGLSVGQAWFRES